MFGNTNTLDTHTEYTINEWTNSIYYTKVIDYLKKCEINSFLDIGACTGVIFEILQNNLPNLVNGVLIEANSTNYNFIKNRYVNSTNVKVINKALFYGQEFLELGEVNNNVGAWSYKSNKNNFKVETITLEDVVKNFFVESLPDLVKIDIEGCEYNFLENSEVLKKIPYIEIEFHPNEKYGFFGNEGKPWNEFWRPFVSKYLPNHKIVLGGEKDFYDGSVLLKLVN
jgi:FkbM family methyltransferase